MAKNIVTLNLDNTDYTVRPYAICRTAANIPNKIITCNGFNLTEGSTILVKFVYGSEINENITLSITYNDADVPKIQNIPAKISNRHKYLSDEVYYEFIYRGSEFVMLTDNDFLSLDGGQLDGNVYIPNQEHGLYMGHDDFDIYQEVDFDGFKTAITPSNILLKGEYDESVQDYTNISNLNITVSHEESDNIQKTYITSNSISNNYGFGISAHKENDNISSELSLGTHHSTIMMQTEYQKDSNDQIAVLRIGQDEGIVSNIYTDKNSGITGMSIGSADASGFDFPTCTGIKLYTKNNTKTSYLSMNHANNYIELNDGRNVTSLFNNGNAAALTLEDVNNNLGFINAQIVEGNPYFNIGTANRRIFEIKGEESSSDPNDYEGTLSMNNISMFSTLGTGCLSISGDESSNKKRKIEIIAQAGKFGIFPTASTTYAGSLGDSDCKWESIYCKDLYGTASSAKILVGLTNNEYKPLNIGGSAAPIYFSNGVPVACGDSLDVDITGNAATATNADAADKLNSNAGNTNTPIYFSNGKPVACGDSLDVDITGNAATATNAAAADKLNSNAGNTNTPIYFSNGKPVACSDSLDVDITGNAATATNADAATTATTASKLSSDAGSATNPIYFSGGVPKQCNNSLAVSITGNATTATTATNLANNPTLNTSGNTIAVTAGGKTSSYITVPFATNATTASKLSTNAGNINTPVYFSNGVPVACDLDINDTYEVTYNNLMNLKNGGKLVPGKKYRIVDYTAAASGRKSWMSVAGNKFDIILEAISTTTLSEYANAVHAKYPSGTSSNILDFTMQLNNWATPAGSSDSWWTEIKNDIQKLAPNIYAGVTNDSLGEAMFSGRSFSKGKATVTFQYQSGNRDVHCLGVVVLNGNQIVAKDIHIGTTGHANNNNVYSLDIPTAGSYQIRMYVDKWRRSGGDNRSDMDAVCKLTVNHIDDYFANCELYAWDIKYCVDHIPERFQWAPTDTAEYKGIIYYMKDEFGNEANYDFKNIKMDGYYTFDYNGKDGSVVTNRVWNNKIALQPNLSNFNLDLPKCYFKNTESNFICANNTIGPNCQNIVFGGSCDSNTIRNYCENITMGDFSSYNDIDTFCKNITVGDYFQSNTIGKNCETITCGSYFVRNKIGNKVSSLYFYKSSSGTTKLDGVHGFVIGDKSNSLTIRCTSSYDTGNYVQYFNIPQNSTGTITISSYNQTETTICVKESGSFKQYKLVDAFGVKVEDATNAEITALFG